MDAYRYGYIVTELIAILAIACSAVANFLDESSFGDKDAARRVKLAAGIIAISGVALTKLSTEIYRFRSRRKARMRKNENKMKRESISPQTGIKPEIDIKPDISPRIDITI